MNTMWRRLLSGGMPSMVASGVNALVPLAGALFLNLDDYAFWALCAALSSVSNVLDFGANSLSVKLAATHQFSKQARRVLLLMTMGPPFILGIIACAFWVPYSSMVTGMSVPNRDAFKLLLLVSVGGALRSCAQLYASVSLGRCHFRFRGGVMLLGSISYAGVTILALSGGWHWYALPLGMIVGGSIQSCLGIPVERVDSVAYQGTAGNELRQLVKSFARSKGLISIAGVVTSQLDRWALALLAPAAVLSIYDIVVRIASVPKFAMTMVSTGLIREVSEDAETGHEVREILNRANRVFVAIGLSSWVVCAVMSAVVIAHSGTGSVALHAAGVLIPLGYCATVFALPLTMVSTGLGQPWLEVRYMVPQAIMSGISYLIAIALQSFGTFVLGIFGSLLMTSVIYIAVGPKMLKLR